MQAASQNGHVDVLKLLLKHNVDLEAEVCLVSCSHLTFGCFFPLKFIAFGTGQTIICCGLTTDLKPQTDLVCL